MVDRAWTDDLPHELLLDLEARGLPLEYRREIEPRLGGGGDLEDWNPMTLRSG